MFQVRLSKTSSQTVTVSYATENVTASAGQDYASMTGTLTFEPGNRFQTILVPTTDDPDPEQYRDLQGQADQPRRGDPAESARDRHDYRQRR